ncbi:metallophosphoesterase [Sphingomonas sp.]|uniref:metallophosphoesterase n=1 Tax=Sphingomonas sp. TaxID=28214 RepID=UPI003D6CCB97
MRRICLFLAGLVLLLLAIALYGFVDARRDPLVRYAAVPLNDWPGGARPVRALLISDIHFGNATMGSSRLARIVDQAMALKPDLILLAGDYVAGHDAETAHQAAAPLAAELARLHAPLGVVAVLGNHDHWTDAVTVQRALTAASISVVSNGAIRRGPLVIGGVDDQFSGHDDIPATLAAMDKLSGAKIILAHTPDVARALRRLTEADTLTAPRIVSRVAPQIVFAGHTHCGQIVLPWLGPIKTVIDSREKYLCGPSWRGTDRILVTGGVGTSVLPMRIGAPPDMWLVTLGPRDAVPAPRS